MLSKSDYLLFLRHPTWLWLKKHDKSTLPPTEEKTKTIFDEGNRFEAYANLLFPEATKLGFIHYDSYLTLPVRTLEALAQKTNTILQGRLEAHGLTCIFDVLDRTAESSDTKTAYDLIEIKASTRVKPEHLYDLAFQLTVLQKAGLTIRSIQVIHVNNEYVRQGEIDLAQLTTKTEVTTQVRALLPKTDELITAALAVLNQPTRPDISPRFVNHYSLPGMDSLKDWLPIYASLTPPQDPYSIYHLCRPNAQQLGQLEDKNIQLISEVPDELARSSKQLDQIIATRRHERLIKPDPIRDFLAGLTFPLYFLDYETFSSVIPQFDGGRPYQDYPFQYSLHRLDSPASVVKHREFLGTEKGNPMPDLLAQLTADIGESGTVLAWNMGYEKKCNEAMASLYPDYAPFLHQLSGRMVDLMLPFAKGWYVDRDFFGSASVKKVLPVLAPELSYADLAIGDGLLARRLWTETILNGESEEKRDAIVKDLLDYCALDTLAMVKIYELLISV